MTVPAEERRIEGALWVVPKVKLANVRVQRA
jgi:hypothetical protein